MANRLEYERTDEDDFTEFIFNVDGYEINYSYVYFEEKPKLFAYEIYPENLLDEVPFVNSIVESDWDFNEEYEEKPDINFFKVIRMIDEIGKIYLTEKNPDCVIFDSNEVIFSINKKLLERFGYKYYTRVEDTYIFVKEVLI